LISAQILIPILEFKTVAQSL